MTSCSFFTFCHKGDFHRLHYPGHLKSQVMSNNFAFDAVGVINQQVKSEPFEDFGLLQYEIKNEAHIDDILSEWRIDLAKPQYESSTDNLHRWKYHVVNHLFAAEQCHTEYIVFADNDCWIVETPNGHSWVDYGIMMLENNPLIWMVSPNDGEPERMTRRVSQQMFLCRLSDFKRADFNQPGWDGNVNVPDGPMPEYWAMLEGRIELYLRHIDKYRYVCPGIYRYWHFNKLTQEGYIDTNKSHY